MSEAMRNVVLAAAIVTAAHIAIRTQDKRVTARPALRAQPMTITQSTPMQLHEGFAPISEEAGMPMDGLREMFEFAKSRDAAPESCDRPDLGPAAGELELMKRTAEPYPEQVAGPHAVLNAYEGEGIANGGSDKDAENVAAFDGWGLSAAAVS